MRYQSSASITFSAKESMEKRIRSWGSTLCRKVRVGVRVRVRVGGRVMVGVRVRARWA